MKTVVKWIVVVGMCWGMSSCFPFSWPFPEQERGRDDWALRCSRIVVNRMGEEVVMTVFTGQNIWFQEIAQDSSWYMDRDFHIYYECVPFQVLNGGVDSVVIYSGNAERLSAWSSFEESAEGRHFFKEDAWNVRVWDEEEYTNYEMTFELLPEDIRNRETIEND